MNKCKHSFFETNKEKHIDENKSENSGTSMLVLPDKYGVRVVCALCGERRIVWQTGEIYVYNRKNETWENLMFKES